MAESTREHPRSHPAGSPCGPAGRRPDEDPVDGLIEDGAVRALQLAATGLLAVVAAASFMPARMAWGVGHWAYLPVWVRGLLLLTGLLTIWTPAGCTLGRHLTVLGRRTVLGHSAWAYGLLPACFGALGWLLRSRVHFLGDGWLLGELVERGVDYHGFDFVDYLVKARLFAWLGFTTEAQSFQLFAVISVLAGVLYAAAAAFLARRVMLAAAERTTLYLLLMTLPSVQLFFGYVECYALLSVGGLLFLGTLLGHYQGRFHAWVPAAAFGFGLFWHLDALFLAPLLVFMLFYPPPAVRTSFPRRLMAVSLPVAGALALAAGVYWSSGYGPERIEADFLGRREGQILLNRFYGHHGMLSWSHWRDVLNLILFLGGIPLVIASAAWLARSATRPRAPRGGAALARALLLFAAGTMWYLLLAALLHMKLGIPRDWDLLAAHSPVMLLAALLLWRRRMGSWGHPRVVALTVMLALLMTAPWIAINANSETAVARFRDILAGQRRFARAYGHEEIGKYYRKRGDANQALAEYERCIEIFPENARFHSALGILQFQEGLESRSMQSFRACLAVDSTYATALAMLARLHADRGELQAGIDLSRRLAGRPDEGLAAASVHAFLAEQLGENKEAIDAYQRVLRRDPGQVRIILNLGRLYLLESMFSNAAGAYREILKRDPASIEARSGLLAALWGPLRSDPRLWSRPENRGAIQQAHRLLLDLAAEGQLTPGLQTWQADIRRAVDATAGPR